MSSYRCNTSSDLLPALCNFIYRKVNVFDGRIQQKKKRQTYKHNEMTKIGKMSTIVQRYTRRKKKPKRKAIRNTEQFISIW